MGVEERERERERAKPTSLLSTIENLTKRPTSEGLWCSSLLGPSTAGMDYARVLFVTPFGVLTDSGG